MSVLPTEGLTQTIEHAPKGLPPSKRKAKGKLVEGQITTDWNKALAQLTTAYPDRFAPHL